MGNQTINATEQTDQQTLSQPSTIKCKYCGNEINAQAKIWCFCQHYRFGVLNWIRHIASLTALIMVAVPRRQRVRSVSEQCCHQW